VSNLSEAAVQAISDLTSGNLSEGGSEAATENVELSPVSNEGDSVEIEDSEDTEVVPEAGSEDSQDSEDSESGADTSEGDIEWIKADGKKTKVDYKDRNRIRKAHELAALARKTTADRDNLKKEFDEYKEGVSQKLEAFDILQQNKEDIHELVRLISGGKMDLEDWRKAKNAEEEEIAMMSPDELAAYNQQLAQNAHNAEINNLKAQIQKMEEDKTNNSVQASEARKASVVNPAFSKYRFAGKLGDPTGEHRIDSMMWQSFINTMETNYKDVEWTQEAAEQEMKMIYEDMNKLISRKTSQDAVQQDKKQTQQAKKQIRQTVAPKKPEKSEEEILKAYRGGNLKGLLSNLGNFNI
jgi:hypothetical protein